MVSLASRLSSLVIYDQMIDMIKNGVTIGINLLFPTIIGFMLLAGFIGFRRGIWRVTYNVFMLAIFYITAFLTLNPLVKTLFSLDLSFAGYTNIVLTNPQTGVTYYAPVTNLLETFTSAIEGLYLLYGVEADPAAAAGFALAIAGSLLKLIIVIIDVIIITLLGWLVSLIIWHAFFKKMIPPIAIKLTKLRWVSMLENAAKYLVITLLFMSPTTAIVNSINQAYQRSKSEIDTESETIQNIGGFLDAYNNSLFAQTFFNWTVDERGITFDARFIASLTEYSINGSTVSLTGELNNILSSLGLVLNVVDFNFETQKLENVNYETLMTEEMVESFFQLIQKSGLITSALPIVTEIAINSDLLNQYFEAKRIGADTINWNDEGENIKQVLIDFVNSDLKDMLFEFDENGGIKMKEIKASQMIKDILKLDENGQPSSVYNAVIKAIRSIDDSNLLSHAVPVAMKALYDNMPDEGGFKDFLPSSWDELSNINWGFEFTLLLDCLRDVFIMDETGAGSLLDFLFKEDGSGSGGEGAPVRNALGGSEGGIPDEIVDFIVNNLSKFGEILFGKFNSSGEPLNVDKYGRTEVYKNGVKQEGVSYCLFDMQLTKKLLKPLISMLSGVVTLNDEEQENLDNVIDNLTSGNNWMKKYKKEFNSIFGVLSSFTETQESKDAVKSLLQGKPLVEEGQSFFDLAPAIIDALGRGLKKLDNSELAYAIFVPMLKGLIMDNQSTFIDIGLDIDYIQGGLDECYRERCFGDEMAKLLKRFNDIGSLIGDLTGGGEAADLLPKLADSTETIAKILDTIAECKLLNPSPVEGKYVKNGNYFNLISYLFNSINMDGFSFNRDDPDFVNTEWVNRYDNNDNILKKPDGSYYGENGNFTNLIKVIGDSGILNFVNVLNSSDPGAEKGDAMNDIAECIETVLAAVDKSVIASKTVGPLFDSFVGGFIGTDEKITFNNVDDWEAEGHVLASMLRNMGSILGDGGFESLDFSKIKDVITLNDMLHNLASSGMFVDKNDSDPSTNYQFGRWLYQKLESTLGSFDVGSENIELLKDPDEWLAIYGDKSSDEFYLDYAQRYPTGNQYIAYHDFCSLTKEDWCSSGYKTMETSSYVTGSYLHYYDNPSFIEDFQNGLNRGIGTYILDELDRLSAVIYYVGDFTDLGNITDLSSEKMSGILNAINTTSPLRICIYNFYDLAGKFIPNDIFSLEPAYNEYLICGDATDMIPVNSRADRQAEIEKFVDLYTKYKDMSSGDGLFSDGFSLDKIDSDTILKLKQLLKDDLAMSNVFHLKGSAIDQHNGNYYPTVFENAMKMMFDKTFSTVLYDEQSPKDIALKDTVYAPYSAAYTSDVAKNGKMDYLVDTNFTGKSSSEVAETLDDLFECLYAFAGATSDYTGIEYNGLVDSSNHKTTDFSNIDLSGDYANQNISSLSTILKLINHSDLLYDCVPNALHTALTTFTFDGMAGVNIADATVYYHYNYDYEYNIDNSLNYLRKYDDNEIDNFCEILRDAQDLKKGDGTAISFSSKNDIETLLAGGETSPFRKLLVDIHDSYSMHLKNEYLNSLTHETVFEQVMDTIFTKSTLSMYAYNGATSETAEDQAAAAAKLLNNIKLISNYEEEGLNNPDGYFSAWTGSYTVGKNEIDAFISFLNSALPVMGDGDFSMTGDMSLDKLPPATVKTILGSLNRVDVIKDAVPEFIKNGLGSVLGDYSKYDGVDYSYYPLTQVEYGGENYKNDVNENSEIYALYCLLDNMYDDGASNYVTSIEINTLATGPKQLDGLMYFLFNTRIFNTKEGVYNVMHQVDGFPISGRGVFMYNVLSSIGVNLADYITGSCEQERIAVLSRIYTLPEATYLNESRGLCQLMTQANNFNPGEYGGDLSNVMAKKQHVLSAMKSAYDAYGDGSYKRCYFSSELVGFLLDKSVSKETDHSDSQHPTYYYEKDYFCRRSGAVRTYLDVTGDSYDLLNEVEYDGMDGVISLLEYIGSFESMQTHKDEISACFAKMGVDSDHNSFLARIYYIAEAHDKFETLTNSSYLIASGMNWEGIIDPEAGHSARGLYESTFSFKAYGESLMTWIDSF